jgi:rhamnulokinase
MSDQSVYAAIDLGAESGRVMLGRFAGGLLSMEEVHRFPNEPVYYNNGLHWDLPRLWLETQRGLATIASRGVRCLDGLGVDTWGLDYGLLGEGGQLLDNPFHYRDSRTDGMVERVCSIIPAEEIYGITGIQFMQINALYQLYAAWTATPEIVSSAKRLLTIPDLLNFWLTGEQVCEYTNATTTQFLNVRTRNWACDLLARLGIPTQMLAPLIEPGRVLGQLLRAVARDTGIEATVIAPACHDTGSAVAAMALNRSMAYISSGTWSLLGCERAEPVLAPNALRSNFTNEGGVAGTIRVLKNIVGMWLVQQCRHHWKQQGKDAEYAELMKIAEEAAPLKSLIDPDHSTFLRAANMPEAIAEFCVRTDQPSPSSEAANVRCILESLALKYRYVLESLERVVGGSFTELRIVGGGARNALLNRFTAAATGKRVIAGPVEATALGNFAVQLLATDRAHSLTDARSVIERSFEPDLVEPEDPEPWNIAYRRFQQYCELGRT